MRYIKPHYYDEFKCIAGQCPATCCAGWQIVIDDDSLKQYASVKGDFGHRLKNSIDWTEDVFFQKDRRCAFLNEENLCDLYKELGAKSLCETCRTYPRHMEEYGEIREFSLSLSCPVAARMILECKEKVVFSETEDEKEDDFEEFDYLLFFQLEEAREVSYEIIWNRTFSLGYRMSRLLALAREMQQCIEENRFFDLDEVIQKYRKENGTEKESSISQTFSRRSEELAVYYQLEILQEEWPQCLEEARKLYLSGPQKYEEIYDTFQKTWGQEGPKSAEWECMGEQILLFFVYTYFCGGVYDGQVYGKMALSVFSVIWIREMMMIRWNQNRKAFDFEGMVEVAYAYAREVEHSDVNLEILEEWLIEEWKGEI